MLECVLLLLETGEALKLEDIEALASKFTVCPKCGSKEGFWLGVKRSHAYIQCKSCGGSFELYEVFALSEKGGSPTPLKFFRK